MTLTDEKVERLAIRAAKGNNGGEWATHYTEKQKEYWRQWVRDFNRLLDNSLGPEEDWP